MNTKTPNHATTTPELADSTNDLLRLLLDSALHNPSANSPLPIHENIATDSQSRAGRSTRAEPHLKNCQNIEDVKTQAEFAADLLRALGDIDATVIHRACMIVASLQMFKAIRKYGNEVLRDMLLANPGSYLNLLNTLCKMVQPTIDLENHRRARENTGAKSPAAAHKLQK